ncbi:peptide-methionine (S)-S-oxide reductase MsrA [Psychromonas sp. GE-S-Ul-11]|uniref:peptide-methionine (S)-S-oxide reductase MsrA n=1 Tax=Psychromonas sp. GE-S-Ul-11 TaxID=3241170 RepID=UPI00390C8B2A
MAQEKMVVGAGCFWCVEAAFNQIEGVISAISGYCGGAASQANYKAVCTGETEHVEVVEVTFDNQIINFSQLLTLFFSVHDATQVNRQGNDIGTQYRSVIFYQNSEQQQIAQEMIETINDQQLFDQDIVTKLEAGSEFFVAEDYHQNYYLNNPNQGYCMAVIAPKFQKFKAQHQALLKK